MRPLRCAIHVHTTLDDGGGSMDEVLVAAREAGVDVLIATGHNHLAHPETASWPGHHDRVLVIMGSEYSTRQKDHLLCLNLHDKVATRLNNTPDALALLKHLGAEVFVPHPQGRPHKFFGPRRFAWQHWDLAAYAGIEIWSYMHDWATRATPWRLPAMCREPDRFIHGPEPAVLAAWDRVAERRHVVGIGALDAHAKRLPLGLGRLFAWARDGILPYAQNFRAFTTYLLTPPFTGEHREDTRLVLEALEAGRAWVAHDALHPAREVRYHGETQGGELLPGATTTYAPGIRLRFTSPVAAHLRILSRGVVIAEVEGDHLETIPTVPGEYRAEAHLAGRPWVFTNHIYLRA